MTTQIPEQNVAIVGAGLAGTLMAMYLARRGWRVDVYERRADPRLNRFVDGRSINMTLATRGLAALAQVMDLNKILELTLPLEGRMVHQDGSTKFQPYGVKKDEVIHAISRSALNIRLLDVAESSFPNINIWFNHRCSTINMKKWAVEICDESSQNHKVVTPDFLIGADGTYSIVRQQIHRNGYGNFRQEYLENGYKELVFAAGPGNSFQMASNALHTWPRGQAMLMAIPNLDGTFASNCILPFTGAESFARLDMPAKVLEFFQDKFPDAMDLIEDLPRSFLANPPAGFPTTWVNPWHSGGRIVLIGDACHTVVPFYGLGMNAAFEDCSILDQCLEKHCGNWDQSFQEFEHLRKVNTDVLAELSLQNFIELRDKARSPKVAARKKVFAALHKMFPNLIVPLYTMMCHTKMPFAEALKRAERQDRWARLFGVDILILFIAAFHQCIGFFKKHGSISAKESPLPLRAAFQMNKLAGPEQKSNLLDAPQKKTGSYS